MKKNRKVMSMALAVGMMLLAASCTKEQDMVTIHAQIGHFAGSKVTMNDVTPTWEDGDKVCVNEKLADANTAAISLSGTTANLTVPATATYKAVYPDEMVTSAKGYKFYMTLPRVQEYVTDGNNVQRVKAPLGAYNGTPTHGHLSLVFNPLGGLLDIHITNRYTNDITVDSVQVTTTNNALWGDAVVNDITAANSYYEILSNGEQYRTVSIAGSGNTSMGINMTASSSHNVYVFIPAVTAAHFTITVFASDPTHRYTFKMEQGTDYTCDFAVRQLATVDYAMSSNNADYVFNTNAFSVSATKQVYFAPGNLQYNSTTSTWQFASTQYGILGSNNILTTGTGGQATTSLNNPTDLFCWGTSGAGTLLPQGNMWYVSTSSIQQTDYDWGWHNSIDANGSQYWYTLTADEWNYVISGRPNASSLIKAVAIGSAENNSVKGVMLMPDSWANGYPTEAVATLAQRTGNKILYNETEWQQLEAAGAVFLPMSGYVTYAYQWKKKDQNSDPTETNTYTYTAYAKNNYTYYWTATPNATDGNKHTAFAFLFTNDNYSQSGSLTAATAQLDDPVHTTEWIDKDHTMPKTQVRTAYLCAVRLVRDVPAPVSSK